MTLRSLFSVFQSFLFLSVFLPSISSKLPGFDHHHVRAGWCHHHWCSRVLPLLLQVWKNRVSLKAHQTVGCEIWCRRDRGGWRKTQWLVFSTRLGWYRRLQKAASIRNCCSAHDAVASSKKTKQTVVWMYASCRGNSDDGDARAHSNYSAHLLAVAYAVYHEYNIMQL